MSFAPPIDMTEIFSYLSSLINDRRKEKKSCLYTLTVCRWISLVHFHREKIEMKISFFWRKKTTSFSGEKCKKNSNGSIIGKYRLIISLGYERQNTCTTRKTFLPLTTAKQKVWIIEIKMSCTTNCSLVCVCALKRIWTLSALE